MKDEPQHTIMGECMEKMIESTKCKYFYMQRDNFQENLKTAHQIAKDENSPVFLIVGKDYFSKYTLTNIKTNVYELYREEALELILQDIREGIFVGILYF